MQRKEFVPKSLIYRVLAAFGQPSRCIQVRVLDEKHEVDSFTASDPLALRSAIAPIYRFLSPCERIEFKGAELGNYPFGLSKLSYTYDVDSLTEAL
jgi:hypothetical protein